MKAVLVSLLGAARTTRAAAAGVVASQAAPGAAHPKTASMLVVILVVKTIMVVAVMAVVAVVAAGAVVATAVLAAARVPRILASRASTQVTRQAMASNHAHSAATSRAFLEMNNHAFRARNSSAKTPAARALM